MTHNQRNTRIRVCATGIRALGFALAAWASVPACAQPAEPAAPASASAPAAKDPRQLGAGAFAEIPFFADGAISPDGRRIAGKFGMGGGQVISVRNLFDANEKPFMMGVQDKTEADWVRWVGNDYLLIQLRALLPLADFNSGYVTRLIGVERATGKVTRILWNLEGQNAANVIWSAREGAPEILVSAQHSMYLDNGFFPTVHRFNLATGRDRVVQNARTGVLDWQADSSGIVRSGVSYANSGRQAQLVYRGADPGQALHVIDRADSRMHESLVDPIVFLPGTDNAVAIFTGKDGRDRLYEVNMLTQQTGKLLFEAPEGTEIDHTVLSADQSAVLGVATSDVPGRVHWLDPDLAELQAAFDKSMGTTGTSADISSLSADRNAMLVTLSRPDTPGALYYFHRDGGRLQRIAVFNAELKQTPLSPVKTVRYKARDGLEIEAVMTVPMGHEAHNLPVVMLPHGGPWAQDVASWNYLAQYIASRGYLVIQPNFRGSTGYGDAFKRKGEGQMGLAMQDDITDGLAWAVAQGLADPKRACIVGASYGGYATMWGLAKDPDLYRCGVSISGVASLRREVNDFGSYFMKGKYTDDWKAMTPDFPAVSPLNAVDRIKAPLLLIHGRKDVTVAASQSDSMASRMRGAGKTVDYLSLPKADHYFTRAEDRKAMLEAIGAWLAKYNPG
jgi:dipeptidyl aminopeptidase/acylaminoacyl peptidase